MLHQHACGQHLPALGAVRQQITVLQHDVLCQTGLAGSTPQCPQTLHRAAKMQAVTERRNPVEHADGRGKLQPQALGDALPGCEQPSFSVLRCRA